MTWLDGKMAGAPGLRGLNLSKENVQSRLDNLLKGGCPHLHGHCPNRVVFAQGPCQQVLAANSSISSIP